MAGLGESWRSDADALRDLGFRHILFLCVAKSARTSWCTLPSAHERQRDP